MVKLPLLCVVVLFLSYLIWFITLAETGQLILYRILSAVALKVPRWESRTKSILIRRWSHC